MASMEELQSSIEQYELQVSDKMIFAPRAQL